MGKLSKSKFYNIKVNIEQFTRLALGEKVMFSHKPIQLHTNLFGQFVALAQGVKVSMPDYNYTMVLEEGIDEKEIIRAMAFSPLVQKWNYLAIYCITYPNMFEYKENNGVIM